MWERAPGTFRTSWAMRERSRGAEGAERGGAAKFAWLCRNWQAKLRLRSRCVGCVSASSSSEQQRVARGSVRSEAGVRREWQEGSGKSDGSTDYIHSGKSK